MAGPREGIRYQPRVVVKFRDRTGLPIDARAKGDSLQRLDPQGSLATAFPGVEFKPLLGSQSHDDMVRLVAKAQENDATYVPPDFFTYFTVLVPEGTDPQQLRDALAELPSVSFAYVEPPPGDPPAAVNPGDDPLNMKQGYLDAAPTGVNARYAWTQPGGDGTGQALVDLERGWMLQHEDLQARGIDVFSGVNKEFFFHGTAILGIIAAVDNTLGGIGIAPGIRSVRCVSEWRTDGSFSSAEPILDAVAVLAKGDILLLEAQTADYFGYKNVPVEIQPAVFEFVRLATASGIVVVAAAGNGSRDLDKVEDPVRGYVLNRQRPEFMDSGAIIVGAATSSERRRTDASNYGNRVDCFAWGENVTTTYTDASGTALNMYTNVAGGTSTAAAIVAGAAVAVQGAAEARFGKRYDPKALRVLLSDSVNTHSNNPNSDRIGVMPDLKTIIDTLMVSSP